VEAAGPVLRPEQFERYRRHLSLPDFGLEGQQKLLESKVLLIGVGGLGCPLALYLSAAGVGHLGLVDDDVVDASNLQRQILYSTHLDSSNAMQIFEPYDVIVDGTDNFPTRYLSNDACVLLGKPNVYGSIFRFEGQATVFDSRTGPCYRCLYPSPPPPGAAPSCEEGGVLGVLPGIIAMLQATETVSSLVGRLVLYDALSLEFSEFKLRKDPKCPVCGEQPTVTELIDYEGFCGLPAQQGKAPVVRVVSAFEVHARRQRSEELLLLDVRDPDEYDRARIEGSTLIPIGELADRLDEIAGYRSGSVVVHCHHGPRSRRACELLIENGFAEVEEMAGGIEAWSVTVDPDVPRY